MRQFHIKLLVKIDGGLACAKFCRQIHHGKVLPGKNQIRTNMNAH